tara:strand:+ start:476 stop:1930 length:1455 start_codon:yes stop_codon:yes gene_type:complete
MKILWCYPNQHMRVTPPGGIAIITACLKRAGYNNIELFDATWFPVDAELESARVDRDVERAKRKMHPEYTWDGTGFRIENVNMYDAWRQKVIDYKPDVIISSLVEDTYYIWKKMMGRVTDQSFVHIVGGVFPTAAPHLFEDNCDYLCRGEGDEAIPEMIDLISQGKSCKDVLNVWPNPLRPVLDVNTLPITDHTIFPEKSLYRPFQGKIVKIATIETQRGCPFKCAYCNSPGKNTLYAEEDAGKFFRRRSIEHIRAEMVDLIEKHQITFAWVITDTLLTMPPREFDEFCDMWEEFNLPFFAQTRPELFNPYQAKRLKEVGCQKINIGVEHGSAEFRKKYIGRVYKNEVAIRAFDTAHEANLSTTCNFIIGYPYETLEDGMESVKLATKLKSQDLNVLIFTPYHGTPLRKAAVDGGFISNDLIVDMRTEGQSSFLNMPPPYMSIDDIQYLHDNFVSMVRLLENGTPYEEIWENVQKRTDFVRIVA